LAFSHSWGSAGSGPGQFNHPFSVAIDQNGHVLVADWGNYRIQVFLSSGQYVSAISTSLARPWAVAVAPNSNIYVALETNFVYEYTSAGALVARWGGLGAGPGQFNGLKGVAVDSQGRVYATDQNNNRVQAFTSSGTFLFQRGIPGPPFDVATDASGDAFVSDYLGHQVDEFNGSGTFLRYIGTSVAGAGQLTSPAGLGVDDSGRLYVADQSNANITVFAPDGSFVQSFGGFGVGVDPCCFNVPTDVAVDHSGNIYVVDQGNNQIKVYAQPTTPAFAATWGRVKGIYR
jgi:streptogramin lyase